MKRSIALLVTSVFIAGAVVPAQATGVTHNARFTNIEPLETVTRSRSDAAEAAAQVPGAAIVLLEALRWRGRTAKQLGLPTQLWGADVMNFVLKKAGAKRPSSRAGRGVRRPRRGGGARWGGAASRPAWASPAASAPSSTRRR